MKVAVAFIFFILSCTSKSVIIHSDFEKGKIDNIWKTKKLSRGGWEVQKDIARSGSYSMKFNLLKGMNEGVGADYKTTERVELKEKDKFHSPLEGDNLYKFSFFIPIDFPLEKTRLVIGQWKQIGQNNPLVAQRYVDGVFYVTVSTLEGKKTILKLTKEESKEFLNEWIDVEYKVKFSHDNGYVLLKVGRHHAQYKGSLAFPEDGNNVYFKFGLYRDQINVPMTIYFDNYHHHIN